MAAVAQANNAFGCELCAKLREPERLPGQTRLSREQILRGIHMPRSNITNSFNSRLTAHGQGFTSHINGVCTQIAAVVHKEALPRRCLCAD